MNVKWEMKKLGDICVFENGDRGRNYPSKAARTSQGVAFINAGHLNNYGIDLEKMDYISRERFNLLGSGKIQKGDILFCLRGSLGKFGMVRNLTEGAIASSLVIVRNQSEIIKEYLLYYFESPLCKKMISNFSGGAAQPNLSAKSLREFVVPLPPLPEQQRIVAVLDQAFAAIDKAIENTEKNLQNAQELIDSYLEKIIDNPLDNCKEVKLGDICNIARGGSPRPIASYLTTDSDGINWLRIGDTKNVTKYIYQTKDKIIPDGISKSRLVEEGDLILSNSMSFGHPYIMKTKACIHDGWLILKEKSACVYKDFLFYVLGSKLVYKQFDNFATGSTVRNLNIGWVKKVKIPLPPFPEQRRIVTKIDALHVETKKLEANYRQKLANLEELRQSFLQKAFAGELLPRKNVDFLV